MENYGVIILAMVAILAIIGLVVAGPATKQGAAVARPLVSDVCQIQCPADLEPATLKAYDGYAYCACGNYIRGPPPDTTFQYDLKQGRWIKVPSTSQSAAAENAPQ